MLQRLGKLNGPGHRIEIIMDMILLPIIFSVRAAISILLLLQAIISRDNLLHFAATTTQVIHQVFHWMGFLLRLFFHSYTGRFWFSILRWIFIVPIILFTFFRNIYNFSPKHRKRSLFEILHNPVPGIEFEGRINESDDFDSLKRRRFNHNLISRRIASRGCIDKNIRKNISPKLNFEVWKL
jgi:hypothetical protein